MADYFSLDMAPPNGSNVQYPNPGERHDIWFDAAGNLQTVEDAEAIAQRVRQRLEFYQGEWFLDTTVGVPWFQFIFVDPFDQATAETFLKAEILDTPGVAEILEFVVSVDKHAREFNLSRVVIRTDYDAEVTI